MPVTRPRLSGTQRALLAFYAGNPGEIPPGHLMCRCRAGTWKALEQPGYAANRGQGNRGWEVTPAGHAYLATPT